VALCVEGAVIYSLRPLTTRRLSVSVGCLLMLVFPLVLVGLALWPAFSLSGDIWEAHRRTHIRVGWYAQDAWARFWFAPRLSQVGVVAVVVLATGALATSTGIVLGRGHTAGIIPDSTTGQVSSDSSRVTGGTPLPTEASSATDTPQPTGTATPAPQVTHHPPTTHADLQWLAARGNASAIDVLQSETVGLVGVCPEPRREVIVDLSVTGQQLAEDILAYFYGQQLDSLCRSLVLAYNYQSEAGDIYTAGRINLDVTDSSGQPNSDPNATNLTYTLTLDIGGALVGQEYVIVY